MANASGSFHSLDPPMTTKMVRPPANQHVYEATLENPGCFFHLGIGGRDH